MKKILVIQYSQTGQLSKIMESISRPLIASSELEVSVETLQPVDPYPFPWPFFRFLDVFPECVALDGPELKPIDLTPYQDVDLVIIAYQVWFLAPALPITSFMQSDECKKLLNAKPVITVIGCRNMWTRAQEAMKMMLDDCGAHLLDNVVLTDQGSTLASFVTTPRWLWTGRRGAFWGFPAAGVSDQDIKACCRFGKAIEKGLMNDAEKSRGPILSGLKAVEADVSQIQSEKAGFRSFLVWGKLLRLIGKQGDPKRVPALAVYVVFLILMIITVVPLTMFLKLLLAPLMRRKHQQTRHYFEAPSGSGDERMEEFGCSK